MLFLSVGVPPAASGSLSQSFCLHGGDGRLYCNLWDQITPFVLKITHKIARGLVVGQDGAGQRQKCFLKIRHAQPLYHSYLKDKASHDESGESTI